MGRPKAVKSKRQSLQYSRAACRAPKQNRILWSSPRKTVEQSTPRILGELQPLSSQSHIWQALARMHHHECHHSDKDQQAVQAVEVHLVVTQSIMDANNIFEESVDRPYQDSNAGSVDDLQEKWPICVSWQGFIPQLGPLYPARSISHSSPS